LFDVIVIGGGIVGASTAYHLVQSGTRTLLIDRHDTGRATDAGAGILSAETYGGESEPWFNLAIHALDYLPDLIEDLETDHDNQTGYDPCGLLLVAASEDEIESFDRAKQHIFRRQLQRKNPAPSELHEISPDEACDLMPPLTQVQAAIYSKKAARMDGRLFTASLYRTAVRQGLQVVHENVDRLLLSGDRIEGVNAQGTSYHASNVVIAGGAWSTKIGDQLGVQIPVEPQRGQIIHLEHDQQDTGHWPIVEAFHDHYAVPWPDQRVVVGATRETGSGFDPYPTASGIHETLGEALRVAPGLKSFRIREIRVGLRPFTIDYLPVLGTIPGCEGVYVATGHGASGLQLGPYSGKLIADQITGNNIPLDMNPYSITRFADARPLHPSSM